jgi:hypothetical protein
MGEAVDGMKPNFDVRQCLSIFSWGHSIAAQDFGDDVVDGPFPMPDSDEEYDSEAYRARLARILDFGLNIQRFFSFLFGTEELPLHEDFELSFDSSHDPLDLVQAHDHHQPYPKDTTWGSMRRTVVELGPPSDVDPELPLTEAEQQQPDGEAEYDEGEDLEGEDLEAKDHVSKLSS